MTVWKDVIIFVSDGDFVGRGTSLHQGLSIPFLLTKGTVCQETVTFTKKHDQYRHDGQLQTPKPLPYEMTARKSGDDLAFELDGEYDDGTLLKVSLTFRPF